MDNFALILMLCLGAVLFAVVGSYAFTPDEHTPTLLCAKANCGDQ